MGVITELDSELLIDLINKAMEKELEDKLWEKWLMIYPEMIKEGNTFVPFDEFKEKHFKQDQQTKTDEEILEDAENILKMMSKPK